jgi:hypothetical protein
MWFWVLYPPLVVPSLFRVPERCDGCERPRPLVVHQWPSRPLPFMANSPASPTLVPRFRCLACNRTVVSAEVRDAVRRHIAARVVVPYCLGLSGPAIQRTQLAPGIALDHNSLYVMLKAAEDGQLRRHHRVNSRRNVEVEEPVVDHLPVANPRISRYPVLTVSVRVRGYGDEQLEQTRQWLEAYLGRLGSGTIVRERWGNTVRDEDQIDRKVTKETAALIAAHERQPIPGRFVAPPR